MRKKQLLFQLKSNIEENQKKSELIEKLNKTIEEKDKALKILNNKVLNFENNTQNSEVDEFNKIINIQQLRIAELEDLLKEYENNSKNINSELSDNLIENTEIVNLTETQEDNFEVYQKPNETFKEKIAVISKEIGKLTVLVVEKCNKLNKANDVSKAEEITNKLESFKSNSLKLINKNISVSEVEEKIKFECSAFLEEIK